jgi:hypothetical protein
MSPQHMFTTKAYLNNFSSDELEQGAEYYAGLPFELEPFHNAQFLKDQIMSDDLSKNVKKLCCYFATIFMEITEADTFFTHNATCFVVGILERPSYPISVQVWDKIWEYEDNILLVDDGCDFDASNDLFVGDF